MLVIVFGLVMKWVRVMFARILGLAVHQHVNFGRADAAAVHASNFECCADIQGFDGPLKKLAWNSSVDQRAKKHVTADAGEAIEVGNTVTDRRSAAVGSRAVVRRAAQVVR
jgi:hypothetical protein